MSPVQLQSVIQKYQELSSGYTVVHVAKMEQPLSADHVTTMVDTLRRVAKPPDQLPTHDDYF